MSKRINRIVPVVWFAGFWVLWAVWQCKLMPMLHGGLGCALLDGVLAKALVWLVLPLPLLIRGRDSLLVPLNRLFSEPFPWLAAVVLICLSAAFLHTVRLLNGLQNTYVFIDPMFIVLSASAGVFEEFGFRGGFFNMQEPALTFWPAALSNGAMFVLFHYPELLFGGSWMQLLSFRALLIFVMGILFCWMFQKWKNLALNMTVHTVWNILSYFFCLG